MSFGFQLHIKGGRCANVVEQMDGQKLCAQHRHQAKKKNTVQCVENTEGQIALCFQSEGNNPPYYLLTVDNGRLKLQKTEGPVTTDEVSADQWFQRERSGVGDYIHLQSVVEPFCYLCRSHQEIVLGPKNHKLFLNLRPWI